MNSSMCINQSVMYMVFLMNFYAEKLAQDSEELWLGYGHAVFCENHADCIMIFP